MCGHKIAEEGQPGGRIAGEREASLAGYETSTMRLSLESIGIRNNKKTLMLLLSAALGLVAVGVVFAKIFLKEEPADQGHAAPDDPFVIGVPVPTGVDAPDVDFVTGTAMGTMSAMSSAMTTTMTTMTTTRSRPATMTTRMTQTATPMMTGASSWSSEMGTTATMDTDMTSDTTSTMSASMTSTMTTTMATTMTAPDEPTESGSGGGTTGTEGTIDPGEAGDERDIEMDLYSARVRFVIRRYYAAQAQSCFDRATRNNPTLSGTVVLNMTIGADGNVSRVSKRRDSTGDEQLVSCLVNRVNAWQLPPPPGGSLQMQLPFSR